MGRINELEMAIRDLRSAAAAIKDVADSLEEMFSNKATEESAAPAEPNLTLEEVRAILSEKSRMGFTPQIRALLQKYGAPKLSQIDPAHYKNLLQDVEALGDGN